MISRTKSYAFTVLLAFTTAASLQAMEFTPEYPFNIKHHEVSTFNAIVRVVCGYHAGPIIGAATAGASTAALIALYAIIRNRATISDRQVGLLFGSMYVGSFVGTVSVIVNQIRYCLAAASLDELVENQSFLDIIKADNGIKARAWLNFYNKAGASNSWYGQIAYAANYAQHATIKNNNGQTALMLAAQYGSVNVARELLAAGANANERDNEGNTALDYALKTDNVKMIALLKPSIA